MESYAWMESLCRRRTIPIETPYLEYRRYYAMARHTYVYFKFIITIIIWVDGKQKLDKVSRQRPTGHS